jgi:hypothetical protein
LRKAAFIKIALNIKIPEKPGIPVHCKILKDNTFTAIVKFFLAALGKYIIFALARNLGFSSNSREAEAELSYSISMILLREVRPELIVNREGGTPRWPLNALMTASLALPFSGASLTQTS